MENPRGDRHAASPHAASPHATNPRGANLVGTDDAGRRASRVKATLSISNTAFLPGADPKKIAASLKRSAERSRRRKADPFRSALSMLTFYINRAGKNLPAGRRKTLQRAKGELRKQFGRD
jgi:Protein of unknown function (DUF3175)